MASLQRSVDRDELTMVAKPFRACQRASSQPVEARVEVPVEARVEVIATVRLQGV